MNGVKSIFTDTLVKRLPRKKVLNLKPMGIKVKRTEIISAKALDRKKIGFHGRDDHFMDFIFTKMKKISRRFALRITNMGDWKLMTISNGNKLCICVSLVVRKVVKVKGEVVGSSDVRDPGGLVKIRWSGGSHGSKLCWRMPSLVCVIHALITVNRGVSRLVANLVGRTRTRVWIPRLGTW
jgi:hypothetical protein